MKSQSRRMLRLFARDLSLGLCIKLKDACIKQFEQPSCQAYYTGMAAAYQELEFNIRKYVEQFIKEYDAIANADYEVKNEQSTNL